MKIHYLVLEII